ncbi:MAG: hypothetical protein KDA28_00255, partial [Phycisphaerales bacterium]|nr:hypothetical protein [Phycisphaerales bacterium]
PAIFVKYANGKALGTIEESFIARLHKGEHFVFAGRVLELVRLREMTATVKRATSKRGVVPRWNGGRFPLSTQLAARVRARLASPDDSPEMRAIAPLLERQRALSLIPAPDELLVEQVRTTQGWHVFLFPFAGRLAHEGMGSLLSLRLARLEPRAVRAIVTDYGIELASEDPLTVDEPTLRDLLQTDGLVEDLLESLNLSELARRQFRVIARIAGLTREPFPGQRMRHVQASSDMFYDVLHEFDHDNLLLEQARREVLDSQLEIQRVRETLEATASMRIRLVEPGELTPFSFPLYAESLRATTVSTESWEDRVRKLGGRLASMA